MLLTLLKTFCYNILLFYISCIYIFFIRKIVSFYFITLSIHYLIARIKNNCIIGFPRYWKLNGGAAVRKVYISTPIFISKFRFKYLLNKLSSIISSLLWKLRNCNKHFVRATIKQDLCCFVLLSVFFLCTFWFTCSAFNKMHSRSDAYREQKINQRFPWKIIHSYLLLATPKKIHSYDANDKLGVIYLEIAK